MFEFDKMCKAFEEMSKGERKLYLQEQSMILINAFNSLGADGIQMFLYFMAAACGADGKLSVEEYSLLQEVAPIQLKYTEAENLVNKFSYKQNKDKTMWITEIVGLFSEDVQDAIVGFCLCFCSADENVNYREKAFIKSLIK